MKWQTFTKVKEINLIWYVESIIAQSIIDGILMDLLQSIILLFDMSLEKITNSMHFAKMEIFKNKIVFEAKSLTRPIEYVKFIEEEGVDARVRLQKFFLDNTNLKEVYKILFHLNLQEQMRKMNLQARKNFTFSNPGTNKCQ